MICNKCKTEVPSQFEFAIINNTCPKCGSKIMADGTMKTYIEIKNRLGEVEFVMDKVTVCERVAMFMVSNYEVTPLHIETNASTKMIKVSASAIIDDEGDDGSGDAPSRSLATIAAERKPDSPVEIREQVAHEAQAAMLKNMDPVIDLDSDEEYVLGVPSTVDAARVERLKRMAPSGQLGKIKRAT